MNSIDVPTTLREMWETRPSRPHDDRMVGGVAAAIGRRYAIDPVLVRVGFVVAAFSGIGVLLYIAGWVVLPDAPDDPSLPHRSRPRAVGIIALAVIAAIGIGSLFDDGAHWLVGLLVAAVLLVLLHRSRGTMVAAPPATPGRVSLVKGEVRAEPPAWDPLGAAPFAWDLPEPGPTPPSAPLRRRLPVTAVTLGVALLAVAVLSVVLLSTNTLGVGTVPTLFGVALAVLGTGLVFGAFVHAGRGLVPIAILLGLLTWGSLTVPFGQLRGTDVGDIEVTPRAIAELAPSYDRAAGSIEVDLRSLDLSVPAGSAATPVQTRLSVGAGDITVRVPADADVTFTGGAGLGDVQFDDRESSGPRARLFVSDDLGADGVRSGRPIVIDAHAGAGSVEVSRD